MLMPGIFKARVISHQWTTAKTGSVGLQLKLAVPGDSGEDEETFGMIWMTEKSMGMARASFKALGFDVEAEDLSALDDSHYLADREVMVELNEENFRGEMRVRVNRIGLGNKPTKEAILAAQQALRDVKKNREPKAAEPAPAKPAQPPPPPPKKPMPAANPNSLSAKFQKATEAPLGATQEELTGDDIPFALLWLIPLAGLLGTFA